MWLLRTFATQSWFNAWQSRKPPIEELLRCFDREKSDSEAVSSFAAITPADELECATAHYQTFSRTDFAPQFTIRFSTDECQQTGIIAVPAHDEGVTGVQFVDAKHFNLRGTKGQFSDLIKRIVGRIWVGEERLRCFPVHQLRYQTAIFSEMPEHLVENAARRRCQKLLSKYPSQHQFSESKEKITIYGDLSDKNATVRVESEIGVNLTRRLNFRVLARRVLHQLSRYVV